MPPAHSNGSANSADSALPRPTILCFSHLRWNFVYQRPQHLLSRAAAHADVFFIEEPIVAEVEAPQMRIEAQSCGVQVMTPLFPPSYTGDVIALQRELLDQWIKDTGVVHFIAWYYTPMALSFTGHLRAAITVYDCMDQLSAFQGAPPGLTALEKRLFERADVVFTGGKSLFEAKRREHDNVHLFPSSIDYAHFAASRNPQPDPIDQRSIPRPRIGFFGVIDERLDIALLRDAAAREPSYHFVLVGPVVKIREQDLPRAANIHYLGQKTYSELPSYIAHWDVAMLPFAQNDSTRFISPTKTPEYLAAGKPVVSTPVRDVVDPYGRLGLARIATTGEEFCAAIRSSLEVPSEGWLPAVDEFLRHTSWDQTFHEMWREVLRSRGASKTIREQKENANV